MKKIYVVTKSSAVGEPMQYQWPTASQKIYFDDLESAEKHAIESHPLQHRGQFVIYECHPVQRVYLEQPKIEKVNL